MDDKLNLQIREGQTVRVFQKLVEGKRERNVPFQGLVKKVRGAGVNKSITVNQFLEGVEVEKIFTLAAPSITKVEIIEVKEKKKKTKRSSK